MSDDEECLNNVAAASNLLSQYEENTDNKRASEDEVANPKNAKMRRALGTDDDDEGNSSSTNNDASAAKRHRPNIEPTTDDAASTIHVAGQPSTVSGNSNVVASHYNTLEEKGLAERSKSRIFHMRNFNNWVKSMLINEYITRIRDGSKLGAPLRVLDMCCGKGGDLYKWEKAHITHLICTDIAAVSVEQCESRYRTLIERHNNSGSTGGGKFFTAEFFACDSTRIRLRNQYKDPSIELNLVSCQFAFHYCFESLQQAECMVKNAAECLRTDGYFIGTIPDAYEIVRRQRIAGGSTFGNDLYEVSFMCDAEEPPLFGGKYNFKLQGVVDCPEFLVHFPLLVKIARKYGLKLVMKESFGGYFRRTIETCKCLLLLEFHKYLN